MRVGDVQLLTSACRIRSAVRARELIGQRADATGSFLRRAESRPSARPTRPASSPAARPARSSPSTTNVTGPATSTTSAAAPSWSADCAASLGRDGHRPRLRVPGAQRVDAGERQQRRPAVAPGAAAPSPCRWSCRGPAPRVVLHLAEHAPPPAPAAGVLEHGRAPRRTASWPAAYAASAAATSAGRLARVAGEAAVGDRRASAVLSSGAAFTRPFSPTPCRVSHHTPQCRVFHLI